MPDPEPPDATPEGAGDIGPGPVDPRGDADAGERTERHLSEEEVAQLQARIREKGRPYEPPTSK